MKTIINIKCRNIAAELINYRLIGPNEFSVISKLVRYKSWGELSCYLSGVNVSIRLTVEGYCELIIKDQNTPRVPLSPPKGKVQYKSIW